jgi:predicted nucleotidyltransferase
MEKNPSEILKEAEQVRDHLLAKVTHMLEADPRVTGAWLSGSYGRGEADEWSDLDLHVVVQDEHLSSFLDEHLALFERCGKSLLIFGGMPSNSMPGGQFWLVQYAPMMLEIDWNIGPTEKAERPEASRVLFERVAIPIAPPLNKGDDDLRRTEAKRQLSFFWAMAPIAIKFTGRGHTRLAVKQVDLLEGAFVKLWYALTYPERLARDVSHQNRPLPADLDARLPRFDSVIDPVGALNVIRKFCQEVQQLHPALAELGASVRDEVVTQVAALAEMAEMVARSGGSNPNRGSRR